MKTIIAGSRKITDYETVRIAVEESKFEITEVVSGTALGVDTLGELYALNKNIPIKKMPADWGKHGKSAGIRRNIEMGDYADALICVHDGKSRGTQHMLEYARQIGLKVFYKVVEDKFEENGNESLVEW